MTTRTQGMTAEDLMRMPNDGFRYELVRGQLKKMAPARHRHGKIALRLGWRLAQHVESNNLGVAFAAETGFLLSSNPDTVRAPDVGFVSRRRAEEVGDTEGYWQGAPDLAVEILSPSDTYTEIEEKATEWLNAGTHMVLVVDPRRRTVTIYRALTDITILTEEAALEGGDIVPGWTMPVSDLFA